MTIRVAVLALLAMVGASGLAAAPTQSGTVPLEYQVKAAYLLNFTKFVEWPGRASTDPINICVAANNPFGKVLAETVRDEQVNGRPFRARVVRQADGCDVLFVPDGVSPEPWLRAAGGRPVLTVGESPAFLRQGGMINFVLEDGKVRFEIDQDAASRANLKISSRLMRLARTALPGRSEETQP